MLLVKHSTSAEVSDAKTEISIDIREGEAQVSGGHFFANPDFLWVSFKYDSLQDDCLKRCIQAYCLGYLHYYEDQVRGGFKNYNVHFDWKQNGAGEIFSVYLDPAPTRKIPSLDTMEVKEFFGVDLSKAKVKKFESAAPPPSAFSTTDPPAPTKPPPPPL